MNRALIQAMPGSPHSSPPARTLGLFDKRLEGDDSLLELARLRFAQAEMGAEMHAGTPEQLEWILRFRPSLMAPVTVHLPRDFNLASEPSRRRIREFAARFSGQVYGMVLHDHPELAATPEVFLRAAREMDAMLRTVHPCPLLFVEYAAGLEPRVFADFFEAMRDAEQISACIDIGHVGIRQIRVAYAALHPGEDICALKAQPDKWRESLPDIDKAVAAALPAVLELIETLGRLGKPMHFHLHDGHPLSTFSPFGVSDHLSFLAEIPLAFEYRRRRSLPLMFGSTGLAQLVSTAIRALGPSRLSFTLELHPTMGRLALGDASGLFQHWRDKSNAEKMNHWLSVLAQNHRLLTELALKAMP